MPASPGPDAGPRVPVSANRLQGAWRLSVTDDGAGVPPEDRERIFELFRRGRNAESDGGVGIGLAICQTIVERHGGRIWVEDGPSGGSRFSFLLPDFDGGLTVPPSGIDQGRLRAASGPGRTIVVQEGIGE